MRSTASVGSVAPDNEGETDLIALRKFVVECPEFRQLEQLLGRFNVFEVLKLHDHEMRHSNILAWLVDPSESHGFGDLFVRRWLMRVLHDANSYIDEAPDPVEIDAARFQSVQVRREWNHIDLLIEVQLASGELWAIAIENKIWSSQHSDQLKRYRKILETAYPGARRCYIFLSVLKEEPEDDAYLGATYGQIADVLDACLSERQGVIADGPRLIVEHYQQIIRSRFMANSEVEALARKIYGAHARALEVLFEYRPDNLLLLTKEIEQRVKGAAKADRLQPMLTTKGLVRFIPNAWSVPKNLEGPTWSCFLCEISLWGSKPTFKAFVGPRCPQNLREQLSGIAKRDNFPKTVNKTKVPQQWYSFYVVKGPETKLEDIAPEDVPATAERIWHWCEAQLKAPIFAQMTKAIIPLLGQLPEPSPIAPPSGPTIEAESV